jgi:hypothetical protein
MNAEKADFNISIFAWWATTRGRLYSLRKTERRYAGRNSCSETLRVSTTPKGVIHFKGDPKGLYRRFTKKGITGLLLIYVLNNLFYPNRHRTGLSGWLPYLVYSPGLPRATVEGLV